jgi:hypothetical protein
LSRPTALNPITKNNNGQFSSLSQLIKQWRKEFPDGLKSGLHLDLIDAVDRWRCMRNDAIHAIVKSEPGEATQPIDFF